MFELTVGRYCRLSSLIAAAYIMGNLSHMWPTLCGTMTDTRTVVFAFVLAAIGYGTGIYKQMVITFGLYGTAMACIVYFLTVFWFNIPGTPESPVLATGAV